MGDEETRDQDLRDKVSSPIATRRLGRTSDRIKRNRSCTKLKSPPRTASNFQSPPPPVSMIQASTCMESTFMESFDEEFIRQQQEILSRIQCQSNKSSGHRNHHPSIACLPQNQVNEQHHNVYRQAGSNHSNPGSMENCNRKTDSTVASTSVSSFYSSFNSSSSFSHDSTEQSTNTSEKPTKRGETDIIASYLDDVELIREQQRILEHIERDQRNGSTSLRNITDEPSLPTGASPILSLSQEYTDHSLDQLHQQTAGLASTCMSLPSRKTIQKEESATILIPSHSQIDQRQGIVTSRQESQSLTPNEVKTARETTKQNRKMAKITSKLDQTHGLYHVDDQSFQVGNLSLRVQGTRMAYDAIANGTAILIQCATCHAILQISSSAKLLYCSLCENVTPVNLAQEQPVLDPLRIEGGSSSAFNDLSQSTTLSSQVDLDGRISRTIQSQEDDVAQDRKLANMSV